ncbi:MAG: starch-binding protein [Muribaculaceae bacterium]|nr:starch-binding protein [Muribaculaceae bacterium]
MKKITTLLLAIAFVAISASATVTINVRTTTGDAPYLYVWNGAGTALNGGWPGTMMDEEQTYTTNIDGLVWFTQDFDEDAINLVFNDGGIDDEGSGAIQSEDIRGVTGTAFFVYDIEEGECEDVTDTYITPTGFDVTTLPAGVVFVEGKEFAYFIAPLSWTKCNVWAWSNTSNFTTSGTWPGDPITLIGNTTDGNPVYQWIGPDIVEGDRPAGIIFNNGTTQTADLEYVAGGVYNLAGKLLYTVTGGGGDTPIPGDVNGDGIVSSVDVTAIYNYLLNNDSSALVNGDQDGDGVISSVDITIIYNILLGSNTLE